MSTLEGLKFRWSDSVIHRLNPMVKLLFAIAVSACALLLPQPIILIDLFTSQTIIILIARAQREWFRTLRGASGVAILVFIISLSIMLSPRYFTGSSIDLALSLYAALLATMKWFVFFAAFTTFFLTTSPEDLSVALEKIRLPYAFCFSIATAVRFIPVLANDLEHITDAQRSRGVDFDSRNPVRRIRYLRPLLLPLIASTIRRSLDLEEALGSRAFGVAKKRTHLYELTVGKADRVMVTISVALIVASIYFGIIAS